jgi:hypothetical protein
MEAVFPSEMLVSVCCTTGCHSLQANFTQNTYEWDVKEFVKIFKAVPQITLHTLYCNLIMVLPTPKHVATLLKQSNFSNYSVVMSHCLSLFEFPRLTIYRAVRLTNCCHAMSRRFVNVSRRFERLQTHYFLCHSKKCAHYKDWNP